MTRKERDKLNNFIESWIREHLDKTNWTLESQNNDFSLNFMREFKDYIDWQTLFCSSVNNNLPKNFVKELGFEFWEHPSGTFFIDVPDKKGNIKIIAAKIKLY